MAREWWKYWLKRRSDTPAGDGWEVKLTTANSWKINGRLPFSTDLKDFRHINTTFQPNKQLTKATMKTIKSPDGDIIDCVLIHFQPAFNNPMLKVTKPLNDGYRSGCYNLLCSGFVQTTHEICLGATLDPVSTYNGAQYDINVLIWKDPRHGNWWLRVGKIVVGYWPVALFPDFSKHATTIEYGGEVYNAQSPGQQPTSTIMGSGHFAAEGFGKASFVRNMEIVDENNVLKPVGDVNLLTEKPNCYDVKNGFDSVWGYYIFFGGPGNNPHCT
ncbi:unnamed protein product [Lactuca virosa]|uniref:Neprosin PEP catalytic domain-containing protein n=1 Tax=Lactuca virosa TaxID=75947 RepID=A0AAU9M725_9ASTR|nr:unnamed protein product [Lactuca virosa]